MKNYLIVIFIIFSTVSLSQDQPVETPAKTVEEAPAVAPEIKKTEPAAEIKVEKKRTEPKTKPANVKVPAKKEVIQPNANTGSDLTVLDINDAKLTNKRIPDIKLPETKVEQASEIKQTSAASKDNTPSNQNFEKKLSLALKIGLAMLVLIVIAYLKMKDKKKRRKVFKVTKR